jgi:hypothetical protein
MVRLQGGVYSNEGRVEVYCNGQWGTICDDEFGENEAKLICRQLGYSNFANFDHITNLAGNETQPIWMDYITCGDSPVCLNDCQQCPSTEYHDCHHLEDVTIECSNDLLPSLNTDGTCRLMISPDSSSTIHAVASTTATTTTTFASTTTTANAVLTNNPTAAGSSQSSSDVGIFAGAGVFIIGIIVVVFGVIVCVILIRYKRDQSVVLSPSAIANPMYPQGVATLQSTTGPVEQHQQLPSGDRNKYSSVNPLSLPNIPLNPEVVEDYGIYEETDAYAKEYINISPPY